MIYYKEVNKHGSMGYLSTIAGDTFYGAAGLFLGAGLGAVADSIFSMPADSDSDASNTIALGLHAGVNTFILANSGRITRAFKLTRPGVFSLYQLGFTLGQRRFGVRLRKFVLLVEKKTGTVTSGVRGYMRSFL